MNSEITKYLQELKKYLRRLDDSEIKDIEDFYTEYLEDAGVQTRAEIEEKVGTPRQLSLRILADYSLKDDGKESGGILPKTNIKTAWLIILALLATPATLIIGVALLGVLVAAIGVAFAVTVTIIALAGAAIFITLTSLYVGIFLLFTKLGVGLFYLGIGIIGIGALMVILPIIYGYTLSGMDENSMPDFLYKKEDICCPLVIQSIHHKNHERRLNKCPIMILS